MVVTQTMTWIETFRVGTMYNAHIEVASLVYICCIYVSSKALLFPVHALWCGCSPLNVSNAHNRTSSGWIIPISLLVGLYNKGAYNQWGWHRYLARSIQEGDTPPPFGTQYLGGDLDGTQYAKGRYAICRNSVISYADINFYIKKVQFSSKNTTHMIYKVK